VVDGIVDLTSKCVVAKVHSLHAKMGHLSPIMHLLGVINHTFGNT